MYFYWKRLCILIVIYVYLLLVYVIVVYVFLSAATLTEGFPCFFLSCKANARVNLAKTGHGPALPQIVVFFSVLFVLCRSVYCLCVNVYCTTATGCQPNCS